MSIRTLNVAHGHNQKKGPAEAATSPSRGSPNLVGRNEMNTHTNSTGAHESASDLDIKKIKSGLNDALTSLSEASELAELVWLAAGSICKHERDAMQIGASSVKERIAIVREFVEQAWNDLKAGAQ